MYPGNANGMSEAHEHPIPDSAETDPAALSSSEDLDEDRLRVDPLEEGVEPPEHYSYSNRYGTTPSEEAAGESIGERLRQEQPDVQPDDHPPAPSVEEDQRADKAGGSFTESIRRPPPAE
ncbi:hypothetical protein Atai01_54250 [Amycolatopsis taiwanensis]|uniref:DUF5709 domain-containing protein n=2 Tax=Amycolatopsis taiwanensis TaxID=342230 RepID=A0A9W6R4K6_9PSEU|nr:hypothetical protein Atai01_54250 [Amycolatopsis taiwanensis]